MQAQSATFGGDATASMPIEVDLGLDYLGY
jgi:hypothetical protein